MTEPTADHPYTDPGDGRTECERCGKWVWPVIHSCKGVPVTARARGRADVALVGSVIATALGRDEFAPADDIARQVLDALAEAGRLAPALTVQLDQTRTALAEILACIEGDPARGWQRTRWIPTEQIQRWRAVAGDG